MIVKINAILDWSSIHDLNYLDEEDAAYLALARDYLEPDKPVELMCDLTTESLNVLEVNSVPVIEPTFPVFKSGYE